MDYCFNCQKEFEMSPGVDRCPACRLHYDLSSLEPVQALAELLDYFKRIGHDVRQIRERAGFTGQFFLKNLTLNKEKRIPASGP